MDTKEFRRGNIINAKFAEWLTGSNPQWRPITIDVIHEDSITTSLGESIDVDDKYLKPIPFTEEWWGKFGYECIQEFLVYLLDESKVPLNDDFNFWVPYIESLPIHKIQNLFYELTGEELTMK